MELDKASIDEEEVVEEEYSQESRDKLLQDMIKFDEEMALKRDQHSLQKKIHEDDVALKEKDLQIKKSNKNKVT